MRGTVIKRGGSWSVVVEHGRNPITGNRIRRWHSGFATKREAEKARTEILSRLDKGTYVEPAKRTIGAFLVEDWLPAVQPRLQASTFDSYQRNVRLHVLPELGAVALQSLTPARLNAYYGKLSPMAGSTARPEASPPRRCATSTASSARRSPTPSDGTSFHATSPTWPTLPRSAGVTTT